MGLRHNMLALSLDIMDGQRKEFAYIPHLDGLRAVSVFAILAFHLRPDLLPGGFLGVDIFFIISGFIITSLLSNEIHTHGRIDFLRFYIRRFKRLFPSFILIILITLITSYFTFDQQKFVSVAKTALFSIFGISNIYYYKTANYFDLASIEKPLLHIWSLNVEEQFYFIWPLLLLVIHKLVQKKSKYFYLLIAILFLLSAYFNLSYPVATFYLPFFRFYEFLVGAAIALLPLKANTFHKNYRLPYFGALMILSIVFLTLDSASFLPGLASLLFIIPTIFLITNGSVRNGLNILEWRFFRFIGKRSYTIYLVHWPVIVIYLKSRSSQQLTVFEAIFLTIIIVLISDLIYRFYETPMRVTQNNSKIFLTSIFALLLLVVAILVPTLILNKKPFSDERDVIFNQSDIDSGKQFRFSTRIKICETKGWENCDIPQKDKFNVLILGDSHAVDALNAFYAKYPDFDYSMSQLGGCPPTKRMTELVARTFPDLEKCIELNKTRFNVEFLKQFDAIVINVLFGWYPPEELTNYTRFLKQSGVNNVIVFGGYLEIKSELPVLINESGFDKEKIMGGIVTKNDDDFILEETIDKLDYLFLSKRKALCNKSDCLLWRSGIPFTWDSHHLSFEFSAALLSKEKNRIDAYLRMRIRN